MTYLHLSVDDVAGALRELGASGAGSAWELPMFALLRRLNLEYGAVFSLYPFYRDGSWCLEDVPSRFSGEFEAAASWLRWGFHGYDYGTDYGAAAALDPRSGTRSEPAAERAAHAYSLTIRAIHRLAGREALDRMPRVHFFAGTLAAVREWRAAEDGIVGLLTADDTRERIYHLEREQRAALAAHGYLHDEAEGVHLLRSLPRLENGGNVVELLESARATVGVAGGCLCLFTHEMHLASTEVRGRIEEACAWAVDNGVHFAFPAALLAADG